MIWSIFKNITARFCRPFFHVCKWADWLGWRVDFFQHSSSAFAGSWSLFKMDWNGKTNSRPVFKIFRGSSSVDWDSSSFFDDPWRFVKILEDSWRWIEGGLKLLDKLEACLQDFSRIYKCWLGFFKESWSFFDDLRRFLKILEDGLKL